MAPSPSLADSLLRSTWQKERKRGQRESTAQHRPPPPARSTHHSNQGPLHSQGHRLDHIQDGEWPRAGEGGGQSGKRPGPEREG